MHQENGAFAPGQRQPYQLAGDHGLPATDLEGKQYRALRSGDGVDRPLLIRSEEH